MGQGDCSYSTYQQSRSKAWTNFLTKPIDIWSAYLTTTTKYTDTYGPLREWTTGWDGEKRKSLRYLTVTSAGPSATWSQERVKHAFQYLRRIEMPHHQEERGAQTDICSPSEIFLACSEIVARHMYGTKKGNRISSTATYYCGFYRNRIMRSESIKKSRYIQ